jgi:hypothetical protein
MSSIFQSVRPNYPGKSVFDLSHKVLTTCDMCELIPVLRKPVIPGDFWECGARIEIRMQPLVSPCMHDIDATIDYFFVPHRILDDDFEDFYTGGEAGDDAYSMPTWSPSSTAVGSLWDYMGLPIGVTPRS